MSFFSTDSTRAKLEKAFWNDPSKFVDKLSAEDIEKDQVLADFCEANFLNDAIEDEEREKWSEYKEEVLLERESRYLNEESKALNIRTLSCYIRDRKTEQGTKCGYRMRDQHNMIPGILYGADPFLGITPNLPEHEPFIKTPWNLIQRELHLYHRSFESRVYDLALHQDENDTDPQIQRVVPANVQRHPIKNHTFCVNYLRYHPKRAVKIPIKYANEEESNALKRGGFLIPITRYLWCLIDEGVPIPEFVELDCTGLKIKEVARMDRLVIPEGLTVANRELKKKDFVVGVVFGKRDMSDRDDKQVGKTEDAGKEEEEKK